ncbi:MAG: leucine--tRNA ligase [Nanoarchaeota archaeon]|nr:leucine--tRNA ligase [Nanoarchaeota archaeon]MBU1027678.1 leucine--tRNA ligase [Nanoarchaeota archaeon]
MKYPHKVIEKKWQKKWEDEKAFVTKEVKGKKKFYCLDMFPYPSGEGLHMGHAFTFSLGDIFARFKRLQGFNVLYPIGYDSLGLPAENAAIKVGTHPLKYTENSIANFIKQQKAMGWSYDWARMLKTSDSEFYKWDQWIFLQMLKKGLAYRKKAPVNWCKKCKTVLANEQVVNGKCWRHENTRIEIKHLEQWYFRITDYADELLSGLDKLDWPERSKKLQRNWIGKSYGTEILFEVNNEKWPIFTTRPDTIYGVTFMVVSAQHSKLFNLVTEKQKSMVEKFLEKIKSVSEKEIQGLEKEGVFTGAYAINPLTKEQIPIYVGNFVLADYGSGMVMAVPAHDQRDYDFAKKYKLKIKEVVFGGNISRSAYIGEGRLINSGKFDGLQNQKAKEKITEYLKKQKLGRKVVQFKLRDWLISRQRYWGTPIPIVYCAKCGIVALTEKDLPIKLPEKVKFGKGNPLETAKMWVNVKCPKCRCKARRETDTMDTFVNSSWYYLRYTDPKNEKVLFDPRKVGYWCPVDQYIGGPEHVTGHLIYFRFYTKFLRDLGILKFDEPALRYFTQGIVHGKDGDKMSKSKGNVVEPFDMIKKYGADTLRLALVSFANPDKDTNWDEKIVESSYNFLNNVYEYFTKLKLGKTDAKIESKLHQTIQQVTQDVEQFKHNLAIIKIRQLFQNFYDKRIDKETAQEFLKMLSIYCPFITEELWSNFGNTGFISLSDWPKANVKKINIRFEKEDLAKDKIVNDILNIIKIVEARKEKKSKVYIYVIPNEKNLYDESEISIRIQKPVKVFAVSDKNKYDPTNKSKNTKPNRPSIYLE